MTPSTLTISLFEIAVPDADLADLRARLANTRWPDQPAGTGWTRGVPVDYLEDLASYWATTFDWRAHEAALNELPQFVTDIDGQRIHFIHLRSPEPDATPLILTHGWPSSPFEFAAVARELADPRAHGGDPADAFHVVIPSLPGYGFSTPLAGAGWGNLFRVAQAWAQLMDTLGYDRYAVHGTDAGAGVAALLAMVAADRVIGTHVTGTAAAMPFGPPLELDGLDPADRERAERFNEFREDGIGYLAMQATRPQTLAYSLTDSPVGQLAWIAEKFAEWTDPAAELPDDAVDRDALLVNVSINWFTGAGASSAHATYEGMQVYRQMASGDSGNANAHDAPAGPPRAIAVFAADNTVRDVLDPDHTFDRWTNHDRGGHFPAMETPDLLIDDLREFFRTLAT